MGNDPSIESAVQQYLDAVAEVLADAPQERQDAVLRDLREHIHEAISARTSGGEATLQDAYAALAEMDLPETYADAPTPEVGEGRPNTKLIVLGLLCSGMQITGLWMVIHGVPVVGAIAGFAAIVSFFLVWPNRRSPRWLVRLSAVAAVCGFGLIIMEISRAL